MKRSAAVEALQGLKGYRDFPLLASGSRLSCCCTWGRKGSKVGMVRIRVKYGGGEASSSTPTTSDDQEEFLYNCATTSLVDDIAREIIEISNLRFKINLFVAALEPRFVPFHGNPKAVPVIRALADAKAYASKDQVLHNKPISYYALRDHVQALERLVMENYQLLGFEDSNQAQKFLSGIPEQIVISNVGLDASLSVSELFQQETTPLRWAGKELMRDKQLCDYIGKNEKTKIVVRLQTANPQTT